MTDDCYKVARNGLVTREITYTLYDDSKIPFRYTHAVITVHLTGDLPVSGATLSGPDNGRFEDTQSVLLGTNPANVQQTFTVTTDDGMFQDLSVYVKGFGGVWGTLGIYKTDQYVRINGDYGGTFTKDGKFVPNKKWVPLRKV